MDVFFNHFIRVDVKLSYSMLVHAWNRGAAIMCMKNTKGIDHVIPVMLDAKDDARFGPLHGPWQKEHIQQARQHASYILINSKNFASGKDQIRAAWATKFSSRNLNEYGDETTESDQSDEMKIQDVETDLEGFDVDSQYVGPIDDEPDDELDVAIGNDGEAMKDIETSKLETDNVFLSLIQDFGEKRLNETWITVGTTLKTHREPHLAQQPLKRPPLDTQFIVILKGIGTNTYQCLKDNLQADDSKSPNQFQNRTRTYLKELTSARLDYVDKKQDKWTAAMQNIPLVYGDSMLGSDKWKECRPALQAGRQAEQLQQIAHGVGEDSDSMDDIPE
jgi:hypothetical protein